MTPSPSDPPRPAPHAGYVPPAPRIRRDEELRQQLWRLDKAPYPAYRDIAGRYTVAGMTLSIDHISPDPFAGPSEVRMFLPPAVAAFPADTYGTALRRVSLGDFLLRAFAHQIDLWRGKRGSGHTGDIVCDVPGQEVLERSSIRIENGAVEVRFWVDLPSRGRQIRGRDAQELLLDDLPRIADRALTYPRLERATLARHQRAVDNAECVRGQLRERGLVAFIANGASLPRRSGVDPRPLRGTGVVPFVAPESMRVTMQLADGSEVHGLGIPHGVTVIVGGGYHGKSTLLSALELGVYNHLATDGRELVVTDADAVAVRAEDGRHIAGVDVSAFIGALPTGADTARFSTLDASGSTSQAAAIAEALESGATALLMDEDTCASNFMIRDRRMQELVPKEHEPITPFLDRVRQLFRETGVSSVIVMGGSGDYLDVADAVLMMQNYVAHDVTTRALEVAAAFPSGRLAEHPEKWPTAAPRVIVPESVDARRSKSAAARVAVRGVRSIAFGDQEIDVSGVAQIVAPEQLRALGRALAWVREHALDGVRTVPEVLDAALAAIDSGSLDAIAPSPAGGYAEFRRHELAAALNRLRTVKTR